MNFSAHIKQAIYIYVNTIADSDQNQSEFDWKNFPATIGIFYFRIQSESFDLRPIDQLFIPSYTEHNQTTCK